MWLCLNNAFISVVDKANNPAYLVVRARRNGDIKRVFPDAKVSTSDNTDYWYRAEIPRENVADAVYDLVMDIDYSNFKNSVEDNGLHSAYSTVWGVMRGLQER